MEHDIPPGGGINVPPGNNGEPVAPKVYFQAPGLHGSTHYKQFSTATLVKSDLRNSALSVQLENCVVGPVGDLMSVLTTRPTRTGHFLFLPFLSLWKIRSMLVHVLLADHLTMQRGNGAPTVSCRWTKRIGKSQSERDLCRPHQRRCLPLIR